MYRDRALDAGRALPAIGRERAPTREGTKRADWTRSNQKTLPMAGDQHAESPGWGRLYD